MMVGGKMTNNNSSMGKLAKIKIQANQKKIRVEEEIVQKLKIQNFGVNCIFTQIL